MPKQNTSPMPDEKLSSAAIAFMKNGSKKALAVDVSSETEPVTPETHTTKASEQGAPSTPAKKRARKGTPGRVSAVETHRPDLELPRRPFSTRIRTDLYVRLKEVSLTRELQRQPPYHMSEIVERAVESWLDGND